MKNLKDFISFQESLLESKLKWSVEEVLMTIDSTIEIHLKKDFFDKLHHEYIDTPGLTADYDNFVESEYENYDTFEDYMISNMGDVSYETLCDLIENNVNIVNDFMKRYANKKHIVNMNKLFK